VTETVLILQSPTQPLRGSGGTATFFMRGFLAGISVAEESTRCRFDVTDSNLPATVDLEFVRHHKPNRQEIVRQCANTRVCLDWDFDHHLDPREVTLSNMPPIPRQNSSKPITSDEGRRVRNVDDTVERVRGQTFRLTTDRVLERLRVPPVFSDIWPSGLRGGLEHLDDTLTKSASRI